MVMGGRLSPSVGSALVLALSLLALALVLALSRRIAPWGRSAAAGGKPCCATVQTRLLRNRDMPQT